MRSTYDWMKESLISNGIYAFGLANATYQHYTGNTLPSMLFTAAANTVDPRVAYAAALVGGLAYLTTKQHQSNLDQQHIAQTSIEDLTQQQSTIEENIRNLSNKLENKKGGGNKKEKTQLKELIEQQAKIALALEDQKHNYRESQSHSAVKTVADNWAVKNFADICDGISNTVCRAKANICNAIDDSRGHIMAVRGGIIGHAVALEVAKVVTKVPVFPPTVAMAALAVTGDEKTFSARGFAMALEGANVSNSLAYKMAAAHIKINGTIPFLDVYETNLPNP